MPSAKKVEKIGTEIVFTHFYGQTSILLPRDHWQDDLIIAGAPSLASFYNEYFGASIGDSFLIIATNIAGGVDISHKYKMPDLNQPFETAGNLGLKIPPSEHVFIAKAGYMFFYTFSEKDSLL